MKKWIYYCNPDASKQWLSLRQPAKVIIKKNRYSPQVMLASVYHHSDLLLVESTQFSVVDFPEFDPFISVLGSMQKRGSKKSETYCIRTIVPEYQNRKKKHCIEWIVHGIRINSLMGGDDSVCGLKLDSSVEEIIVASHLAGPGSIPGQVSFPS